MSHFDFDDSIQVLMEQVPCCCLFFRLSLQEVDHPYYNPYYQYHSEAIVMRDLPAFDNHGYDTQPPKQKLGKDVCG